MTPVSNNRTQREYDKFTETSGGKTAVRVVTYDASDDSDFKETPRITNLSLGTSEVSHVLLDPVKSIQIKARGVTEIFLSYQSGGTGSNFLTIPAGSFYEENGLKLSASSLYLKASKPNQTVEIIEWG